LHSEINNKNYSSLYCPHGEGGEGGEEGPECMVECGWSCSLGQLRPESWQTAKASNGSQVLRERREHGESLRLAVELRRAKTFGPGKLIDFNGWQLLHASIKCYIINLVAHFSPRLDRILDF
jgi:hypothetical protein